MIEELGLLLGVLLLLILLVAVGLWATGKTYTKEIGQNHLAPDGTVHH